MKIYKLFIWQFIFLFSISCFCIEIYLETIKLKTTDFLPTSGLVITHNEIEKLAKNNVFEILKLYNTNIQTRGQIQADISLNAGSFEQTKLYLNGIPITDPQTAHHNCNLPVNIDDIESIQIINKTNFAVYGTNAFSGVINILTKKYILPNMIDITYGNFGFTKLNLRIAKQDNFVSLTTSKSDGFKENTDYKTANLFSFTKIHNTDIIFALLDKHFGAQDFYTTPNTRTEYEQTRTIFVSVSPTVVLKKNCVVEANFFSRYGYDYYTTQRYSPQVYSNYHNTYLYGTTTKLNLKYNFLFLQHGIEILFKHLDSKGYSTVLPSWKGMGELTDEEYALYTNLILPYKSFSLETTLRLNYFSRYNLIPQWGTAITFLLSQHSNLKANISKVFRIPSYTELFYWDPIHKAQEELKVEHSINYSLSLNHKFRKNLNFSITGFIYEPTNTIDWLRMKNSSDVWKVSNIAKVDIKGIELVTQLCYKNLSSSLFITFIEKTFDLQENLETKYLENFPKQTVSLVCSLPMFYKIETTFTTTYKHFTKTHPQEFVVFNLTWIKNFTNTKFYLTIDNLFNIKYEEFPGVQSPPRQISCGTKIFF